MSEKDKLSFNEGEEEEFHITDEDIDRELAAMEMEHASSSADDASAIDVAAGKSGTKQRFAKLKQLKRKHWIVIAIVVIMLLFGLVKFLGNDQSSSFEQITPVAVQSAPAVAPVKRAEPDLTKTVLQPQSTAPKADALLPTPALNTPVSATAGHEQLKVDLATVVGNENKLTAALESIQQQNKMLTQQLTDLSHRVQGLESSFNQSNQVLEGLSQEVVKLQTGEKPAAPITPAPAAAPASADEVRYTVQAVVPQRAWLQTTDGSTITVMIGDTVPGLGAVMSIDPYSGNVTTASGAVIKYGN